ncbi:MAG: 30S ribosomal protein S21 [Dehalococcoidia bacterium]|nr:30S ribosomal protein S21 [Dehalococcoidia bacterium]
MSSVILADGETFESMLRRFNKKVQADGILSEVRKRQHFESPSVRRKKKAAAKRRKSLRR